MSIASLLEKMLVFVVLMAIGYIGVRTNYLSKAYVKDTSKMVINVFMSATIVNSCLTMDAAVSNGEVMKSLLLMSVMMIICFVVGFAARCVTPLSENRRSVYEMLISMPNSMFIALPVLSQLYGAQAVFYCALSSLPMDILVYTYGVTRLKQGGGVNLKDIISAPLIASIVGVLMFFFKIRLPYAAENILTILSGATMPLSMVVVGASLGAVSFTAAFKDAKLYLMSLARLIICPLVIFFVIGMMTDDAMLLAAAVITGASPSAVLASVLSIQYGRDGVFASEGVLLSTVLSMLTIPLVVWTMNIL